MNRILNIAFIRVCVVFWIVFSSNTLMAQDLIWSGVSDLSAVGRNASTPKIALSSDGTKATVVWVRNNGSHNIVQSASATISGNTATWSSAQDLSDAGSHAYYPEIALSSDGTKATAVWSGFESINSNIQTVSATISGNTATWSAVKDLPAYGTTDDASVSLIALSSDGTKATAVWRGTSGSIQVIQSASATISGNAATWSSVKDLSDAPYHALDHHFSLSSDGTKATAVWNRWGGSYNIVQSASATISGNTATWSSAQDLHDPGTHAYDPKIALSSDGTKATAVWSIWPSPWRFIQSASATISGNTATWSSAQNLSGARHAYYPEIALSSDGTKATVVWELSPLAQSVSATISGNTSTWGAVKTLSKNAKYPKIGLSSDGTKATAVWSGFEGLRIVQSAPATINGNTATWGVVKYLSASGENGSSPQIDLSSDGAKASTVWYRSNGSNTIIQSASAIEDFGGCYVVKSNNGKTIVFCL